MNKVRQVYLASGWFNSSDESILTELENYLSTRKDLKVYSPRKDGVKLEANQFHDPKLREKVFLDNIHNIEAADFVLANLDGRKGQDTGTCYEVGYAMAKGIPVIGYQDVGGKLRDQMSSIVDGMVIVCTGVYELDQVLDRINLREKSLKSYNYGGGSKVLYIAPDSTKECLEKSSHVASILVECFGKNFRWVDKLSDNSLALSIEDIFNDIEFMVAVIDDKHPIVSYMLGQCYARKIPIISYTNYDYGVNLMLALSILQHIKGPEALKAIVQQVKRNGIMSLSTYDNSNLKVF